MEERTLLSTFTVTNTQEGGPGSLGQAIVDANTNPGFDIIQFHQVGGIIEHTIGLDITDAVELR